MLQLVYMTMAYTDNDFERNQSNIGEKIREKKKKAMQIQENPRELQALALEIRNKNTKQCYV